MKQCVYRVIFAFSLIAGFCAFFGSISGASAKSNQAFSTLLADYQAGAISYHQYLVYQGYLHFNPARLSNLYPGAPVPRERLRSSPVIREIMQNWDVFTPAEQEDFKNYFARPSPRPPYSIITPSGFFKVHYHTSGSNAVPILDKDGNGIPDFVDAVIEAAEKSLAVFRSLGYRDPHLDTGIDGPEFDIYLMDVTPRNIYGETFFPPDVYMIIDNDFSGSIYTTKGADGARVTVAHELHHAVQFSYTTTLRDPFFWEATSTYFESVVYPDIKDYLQYLPDFFAHPEYSFNKRDGWHEYGLAIWNHYTEKKFDGSVLRRAWEIIGAGQSALDALDNSLKEKGADFNSALGEFYAWNCFTGTRADTVRFYDDGRLYPMITFADSIVLSQDTVVAVRNNYLTPGYVYFKNMVPARYSMRVNPEDDSALWENSIVFSDPSAGASIVEFEKGSSSASLALDHTGALASMIFVPVSTARVSNSRLGSLGQYSATLTVTVVTIDDYDEDKLMVNYPNPFIIGEHGETVIPYSLAKANEVEFYFFSSSGRLVRKETLGIRHAGYHPVDFKWDGTDDDGKRVGSGIYILHMKLSDKTLSQKIAVIR